MTTETIAAAAPAAGNTPSTVAAPAVAATTPAVAPAADSTAAPAAAAQATTPPEAPKPVPKAPEKYSFKAEGIDPGIQTKFESLARELDLSQEDAAKLIDQIAPEMTKAQEARMTAARTGWIEAAKVDKEFGGDKLQENMAVAKKALETFGTPELTKLLNDSGLGNHPEIIRAFFRAGQKITSGSFVPSGQGSSQASSAGSKLYPSMK